MDLFAHVPKDLPDLVKWNNSVTYDWEQADVDWWRFSIIKHYPKVVWIGMAYLLLVFLGPILMKNRESFRLKKSLVVWNASLALFSIACVFRTFPEFKQRYLNGGLHGMACDLSQHYSATSFWVLAFVLSKILELGDTVFLVLNKRRIIFLHYWHHFTVMTCGFWLYPFYEPYVCIGTFLNVFVHSFMYTYYAFMAAGIKIPKILAMCLTCIQLTQFAIFLAFNIYVFYVKVNGGNCFVTYQTMRISFGSMFSYLILFLIFFKNNYFNKGKRLSNGEVKQKLK